jgi:hypothetical protein
MPEGHGALHSEGPEGLEVQVGQRLGMEVGVEEQDVYSAPATYRRARRSRRKEDGALRVLVMLLAVLVPLSASAQKKRAQGSRGPPCSAGAYRQFDFWIGDWEVQTPKGTPAGENKVEKILEGCALRETWTAVDGSHGSSLSSYDGPAGRWTQTFVDDLGMVLVLDGEFREGKMTLSGRRSGVRGSSMLNRIVWQRMEGDKIRQRWEQSSDDGKNWTLLFEGIYSRKKG